MSGIQVIDSINGYTGYRRIRQFDVTDKECKENRWLFWVIAAGHDSITSDIPYEARPLSTGDWGYTPGWENLVLDCDDIARAPGTVSVSIDYTFSNITVSDNPIGTDIAQLNKGHSDNANWREYLSNIGRQEPSLSDTEIITRAENISKMQKVADSSPTPNELLKWFSDNLSYISNPNARVKEPFDTIRDGGGDCDDLAYLFVTLLEMSPTPTSAYVVPGWDLWDMSYDRIESLTAYELNENNRHAIATMFVDGKWVTVDLTTIVDGGANAYSFPFAPLYAYDHLNLSSTSGKNEPLPVSRDEIHLLR